jgi:hypothetical protein
MQENNENGKSGKFKKTISCTRLSNDGMAIILRRIPKNEGQMLVPEFDDGSLVGKNPGPRKYPEDPILCQVPWKTEWVTNQEEHFMADVIDAGSNDIDELGNEIEVKVIYSLLLAIKDSVNAGVNPFDVPVTVKKTGSMKNTRVTLTAYEG